MIYECMNCRAKVKQATLSKTGSTVNCEDCGMPMVNITDWNGGKCSKCGSELPDKAKFCPSCGARTSNELKCPNCDSKLPRIVNFCPACGVQVKINDVSPSNILASLGYAGIKQCSVCKTYFPATKMNCPKCGMKCGETIITNALHEKAAKNGDTKAAAYLKKCAEIQMLKDVEEPIGFSINIKDKQN